MVGTSGQAAPGAFNGTPFFAPTGPLAVSQYNGFGGELLWVRGPLSLQSEAMVTFVQQTNGGEATLPGAYAQVGYFLTGEHRPYDRKAGAIDRVIPHENFFRVRTDQGTSMGTGAWEVAARVSWLDLEDQAVRGVLCPVQHTQPGLCLRKRRFHTYKPLRVCPNVLKPVTGSCAPRPDSAIPRRPGSRCVGRYLRATR